MGENNFQEDNSIFDENMKVVVQIVNMSKVYINKKNNLILNLLKDKDWVSKQLKHK